MKSWIQKQGRNPRVFQVTPSADLAQYHDGITVASFEGLAGQLTNGINVIQDCSINDASVQLLTDQSRSATFQGPMLQEIHRQMGARIVQYLIAEYSHVANLVEETSFPHVQNTNFAGITAAGKNLLILPLMRGGEPMARGVYETFPQAQFVHYQDEAKTQLDAFMPNTDTILVVDSVMNKGRSMRQVLRHLARLATGRSFQVFVLCGVAQAQAAHDLPRDYPRVRFVTLRISNNQYTGKGGTDTGNRLFGTIGAVP